MFLSIYDSQIPLDSALEIFYLATMDITYKSSIIWLLLVFPLYSHASVCSIKVADFGLFFKKNNQKGIKCIETGTNVFSRTTNQPFIKYYDCQKWNLEKHTSPTTHDISYALFSKKTSQPVSCKFQVSRVTPGEILDSYYGNGTTQANLPSRATLIRRSKKVFNLVETELPHLNFKDTKPLGIYYISQLVDYQHTPKTEPRILASFEVKRSDGRYTLLGIQFSIDGDYITIQDLTRSYSEDCIPYLIHEPGKFTVYYSYNNENEDLWKLRDHFIKATYSILNSKQLLTPRTQIQMSMQPNMNPFESQQSFTISEASGFSMDIIQSMMSSVAMSSKYNLFASISRSAHPVEDINTECVRIK